jgi:hypothetical protein
MSSGGASREAPGVGPRKFPENREFNREFLEISLDSCLLARFLKPVAKRIRQLAANSLFLRKQGNFSPEQGIRPTEQGIRRQERRRAGPQWAKLPAASVQHLGCRMTVAGHRQSVRLAKTSIMGHA